MKQENSPQIIVNNYYRQAAHSVILKSILVPICEKNTESSDFTLRITIKDYLVLSPSPSYSADEKPGGRGEVTCLKLPYPGERETESRPRYYFHYTLLSTVLTSVIFNSYNGRSLIMSKVDISPRNYDL